MSNSEPKFTHRGAIVRIRLRNFMTYNNTEIKPGPNLNMILGPNGTGKSAMVCAIIVGLAGEVTLTGRANSAAGLVKKGQDSGSTEIELYNDKGPNYVIKRKIIITDRSGERLEHRSEWKINGKTALKNQVCAITKKLSIKVDNLCQFLPQDSVTNFVKMDSRELLFSTLEAAGDSQLVEDHKILVSKTNEVAEKMASLEILKRQCQENEVNKQRLEDEVTKMRQREQLVQDKTTCLQKVHYVTYLKAKEDVEFHQDKLNEVSERLMTLEGNAEPYQKAVELYKKEESKLVSSLSRADEEERQRKNQMNEIQNAIDSRNIDCQEEFNKFKSKQDIENRRDGQIRLQQQELESLECKLDEVKNSDYSSQIVEVEAQTNDKRAKLFECAQEKSDLDLKLRQQVQDSEKLASERDQIMSVSDRKKNLLYSRSSVAQKVMEMLAKNSHQFKERIIPPMMCEINVKDTKYSGIVEHAIPSQELLAFVCQNESDLRLFTQMTHDQLKVRCNVILAPEKSVEQFESEFSQRSDDLSSIGLKISYLKDLIDAPDPIMRYLCGSCNFHRTVVVDSCTESQLKKLLDLCPKFYVGRNAYAVSRSRYDQQIMTVSDLVRDPSYLIYSLDTKKLAQCQLKIAELEKTRQSLIKMTDELDKKHNTFKREWQTLADCLKDLKLKQGLKSRLESMIKSKREEIHRLKNDRLDMDLERSKLHASVDKINCQIIELLEKNAVLSKNFTESKRMLLINRLLARIASRNHKIASRKLSSAKRDLIKLRDELKESRTTLERYKQVLEEAASVAEERIPGFSDGKIDSRTKRKFSSISESTVDELKEKIEHLAVKIRGIHRDNTIVNEFNRQTEELKDRRLRIEQLEESIRKIDEAKAEIKNSWREKVDKVISVVNKNYQEKMRSLRYEGQVKLDFDPEKPDNFACYGIVILVRYRDNEQLIPLSATRQSGGERSVATMIYMLALQTQTTVPFRCVDEINQGMDKENERKVFELLVDTADRSSSQYFLVSPKLLDNLPYSEKMKIHIVFNGKRLHLAWNELERPSN